MDKKPDIVITGVGVVSPIGIGKEAFWSAIRAGRSGVRRLEELAQTGLPGALWGVVDDFDPKQYVRPRKSLKVMSRDIQIGFSAADLACQDAGFTAESADPERVGVVFGADLIMCELPELVGAFQACTVDGHFDFARWGQKALAEMYPLWMLKYLPNMPACHIGIAHDARGPTNSHILGDVSSLSAVIEAVRVLERDAADVMMVGGTSSRIPLNYWFLSRVTEVSNYAGDPAQACRPFDAERTGLVHAEGAGAFLLERREHAERRGAPIYARVLGSASTFEPHAEGQPLRGDAIRHAITGALRSAGVAPEEVGQVNAHGLSTHHDDRIEARAIRDLLGDVPVTAPKSFFGAAAAAAGALEMAATVAGMEHGLIPPTLNYEHPDPECPVCVVAGEPHPLDKPVALMLNHARNGQAVAVVIARE